MPTVFRLISKMSLFVLIIVVSAVSTVQAQTEPDTIPPSTKAAVVSRSAGDAATSERPTAGDITPEVIRHSARMYATTEQATVAAVTGGAEYMFSEGMRVLDNKVESHVTWTFYKINGREDHFFVETVVATSAKDVSTDPYETYRIFYVEPYMQATTSTARLQEATPELNKRYEAGTPITFALDYQGAGISVTNVASSSSADFTLSSYTSPTWHSVQWMSLDHTPPYPNKRDNSFTFVSRWEGGEPWGFYRGVVGSSTSSLTDIVHDWGFCPVVEEGSYQLQEQCDGQ